LLAVVVEEHEENENMVKYNCARRTKIAVVVAETNLRPSKGGKLNSKVVLHPLEQTNVFSSTSWFIVIQCSKKSFGM
jgi:hypothetical protein